MLGRFGISATYSVVTLYTAELYPTEIRSSALGTCSTWAHVGSITAPYAVDLLVGVTIFYKYLLLFSFLSLFRVPLDGIYQQQYVDAAF